MSLNHHSRAALEEKCRTFRRDVLTALYHVQTGHPGGSLSVCEILACLYLEKANVDPERPDWPERDRVILSKGHAAPMLYRLLAERGFFSLEEMARLRQFQTMLQGHPCAAHTPGVDMSTGPLGLGLGAGLGIAQGLRLSGIDAYTYVVLGDGELDEGTVWEAVMAAHKFQADHLIAIVDHNGVQLDGPCDEVMPLLDIGAKFRAFGWHVLACDGHDVESLCGAIDAAKAERGRPTVIVAETLKGKGVSFMEGQSSWHGKPISEEEYRLAMWELEVRAG